MPKNKYAWQGGVNLLDPETRTIYQVAFGNGMNSSDLCEGCDDYLYLVVGHLERYEIEEEDGGQMDFNRKKSNYRGDIRNAIPDAMEFLGVSGDVCDRLIYIASFN